MDFTSNEHWSRHTLHKAFQRLQIQMDSWCSESNHPAGPTPWPWKQTHGDYRDRSTIQFGQLTRLWCLDAPICCPASSESHSPEINANVFSYYKPIPWPFLTKFHVQLDLLCRTRSRRHSTKDTFPFCHLPFWLQLAFVNRCHRIGCQYRRIVQTQGNSIIQTTSH